MRRSHISARGYTILFHELLYLPASHTYLRYSNTTPHYISTKHIQLYLHVTLQFIQTTGPLFTPQSV